MQRKSAILLGIAVIGILGVSLGVYAFKVKRSYELISPKRGAITEAIYGLGKVKTYSKYDVKIGVMSTVRKIFVREGDTVKKGDPLIRFAENLTFSAPINGTVTFLGVDESEAVAPQMAILSVQDLNDKYIEVSLEQQGALRVQKGQSANVIFESLRGAKIEGKVKAIFPKNDEFLAHIQVEGLAENVLPGMTADVSITVGQHSDALLVPLNGVSHGHVTIQRQSERLKIPIKIGGVDGQWAEVEEGDIQENDLIVVKKNL